jgi:peroxiredoxin Q/BCP
MGQLIEGQQAPDFSLRQDDGNPIQLSSLRGSPVVVYFYPKDDTPGCTIEACGFRDDYADYRSAGVEILGISPDTAEAHVKFKKKFGIPFPLLIDPDHAVAEQYGVWVKKQRAGKSSMGIRRTTFLIDSQGKIRKIFENVQPEGHSREILAELAT